MKRTQVNIHLGTDQPEVRVMTTTYSGVMLALDYGEVSLHVDGYNADAIHARALAKLLTEAADQVDVAVAAVKAAKAQPASEPVGAS